LTMARYWKVISLWILSGILLGLFFAFGIAGPSPGGGGAVFLPIGFLLGVVLSIIHCFVIFYLDKDRKLKHLTPVGIVLALFATNYISGYVAELTCEISESNSRIRAIEYSESIGFESKYLTMKPFKLDGCKLGFEYSSHDNFRLVIVDENGSVRLND